MLSNPHIPFSASWRPLAAWLARDLQRRRSLFFAVDALLLGGAMVSAMTMSFLEDGREMAWLQVGFFAGLSLGVKLPVLYAFGLYNVSWRYVGVRDMVSILWASTLGSTLLFSLLMAARYLGDGPVLAVRTLVLDSLLSLVLLGSLYAGKRVWHEWLRSWDGVARRRVLIVGAGSAGEQVARRLREEANSEFRAVGIVDDDAAKMGSTIHGVPILGTRREIPDLVARLLPDELWIAMPSIPGNIIRETVELGRKAGLRQVRIVPGLGSLINGQVRLADLRPVQPEDLLRRDVVHVNTEQVSGYLTGKCVLVTGGAGSIGSELCRQIAKFGPDLLVLLDQDETGLFNIQNALAVEHSSVTTQAVVANICDADKVERVFREYRPNVVFHAAAYKHVPLMELQPDEAIKTNVLGTQNLGFAALRWKATNFVLVSTDKAVNPRSVMGATKRAAEVVIQELNRAGTTEFVAVRFGNVLGSRGSVVPIFQEQIARNGPVTVTHPEMRRYFMTVQEAVMLVLQAGAIGTGGEVLVLDMGEPVKIVDLARQLISLSGLEPDRDIPIVFTGLRPGEKLFEDILTAEEGTTATCHDRIFAARVNGTLRGEALQQCLLELQVAVRTGDRSRMVLALRKVAPTFEPYEDELARETELVASVED